MLPVEPGAAVVHTRGVRVLFASTAGAGHFHPLKPFVEACVRQGHDVLVAGPPALAESVAGAGYAYWRFDEPPPDELGQVWSRVATVSADEANVIVIRDIFGRLDATASVPRLRRACDEWRPEVVVRETSEYGSAIAAELSGIPHVRVGIGLASLEELALGIVAETLDDLRRSVGLAADPGAGALRRSPYLTMVPASLEDPAALEPPTTLRFRDPAVDARSDDLPRWWAADDAPLVYVTFGSVAGGMEMTAPVYRLALEAVAALDVRVLFTVGHDADLDRFGSAPPNVHIERWVPQGDVLAHADAVVCHGGSGSTLGALAAGVPIVVVPLFADQPLNARRIVATGAGISVAPPDAVALRSAVVTVLDDRTYRGAAARLASEMHALPATDAAVEFLGAIARSTAAG
jgi:UDP:flavonoid glycosyltransferase YjiC (YdhE family)